MIHRSWMIVPEHTRLPFSVKPTIHGHEPCATSLPLIIRSGSIRRSGLRMRSLLMPISENYPQFQLYKNYLRSGLPMSHQPQATLFDSSGLMCFSPPWKTSAQATVAESALNSFILLAINLWLSRYVQSTSELSAAHSAHHHPRCRRLTTNLHR